MAIKSRFAKEEWQMIADAPEWIFAALAAADGNVALTTKAKESKAFKKVVKNYSTTSNLVQDVVVDKTKTSREVKGATLSDAEQALEEINNLLESKLSRREADQYRKFLISVADSVAEAAGEGALGLGQKISKKEAKALDKIKAALKPLKAAKVEAKPVAKPTTKPKAKPTQKPVTRPAAQKPRQSLRPRETSARPSIPSQRPAKKQEFIAEHTIAAGETLSHISLKYYGSAVKAKYMIIYEANKDVIGDNPNMISVGKVLRIPKLEK